MGPIIIYISSDARSGSTLLDQLLGSHPSVTSVGEIYHLGAYALQDRTRYNPTHPLLCTCGKAVTECEFWSAVQTNVDRSFAELQLYPRLMEVQRQRPTRDLVRRFVAHFPHLYRYRTVIALTGGARVGRDSFSLFDAIRDVSGQNYIVDSSKSIWRFRALHYERPKDVRLILLSRDYRAVAYSKMQRGEDIVKSVKSWVTRLKQMEELSGDMPREQLRRVRYEDLCDDPEKVMRGLCEFIGLEFMPNVLSRSSGVLHHIGGSPSKFREDKKKIVFDAKYLSAFSASELDIMRKLVGDKARMWGYN